MKNRYVTFAMGMLVGAVLFGGGTAYAAGVMAEYAPQRAYVDGTAVQMEAYNIGGYNYVKLRDIGQMVGFNVYWDGKSVQIDSDAPYTGEAPADTSVRVDNYKETGTGYLTNGQPVTEENVLVLLRQIELDWPTGTVWGTNKTLGTHKNEVPSTESGRIMRDYHVSNTYACGAYASMVSSLIFGDTANPGRKLDDISKMRPGDIVFLVSPEGKVGHVVVALESPNQEGRFHHTEGNLGEAIAWPSQEDFDLRSYSLAGFRGGSPHHLEVWTRYPENIPYTGNSVMAWPTGN